MFNKRMGLCAVALSFAVGVPCSHAVTMVNLDAGVQRPFFKPKAASLPTMQAVGAFAIDATPVTNGEFLEFVRLHPEWRRDQIASLFAEKAYLQEWQGALTVAPQALNRPVTHVSWFAARAYCAAQGKRLPTTLQWEYAATAGRATSDEAEKRHILTWYAQPTPQALPAVGSHCNARGICDLYGLVWEWTEDFDAESFDADDAQAFICGGAAQAASDTNDYASFMRYALRASLKGSYVLSNLGFRCAQERILP